MISRSILIHSVAFLGTIPITARAADVYWLDPAPGQFTDGANWVNGIPPGPGDQALFGANPGANPFVVSFSGNQQIRAVEVFSQQPTWSLNGNACLITDFCGVGRGGTTAHWTVSDGAVTGIFVVSIGRHSNGVGVLSLENAAVMETELLEIGIGDPPATGTLSVSGLGSRFVKTQCCDTNVGGGTNNTGAVIITDGAVMDSSQGNFMIGRDGGTGTLNLATNGSLSVTDGGLWVGTAPGSVGWMSITGGATAQCSNYVNVGDNGGNGTVTVDGIGSALNALEHLWVGTAPGSVGWMSITGGATAQCNDYVNVGDNGGNGTVTVDGIGSALIALQHLRVGTGALGVGSISIANGGQVVSTRHGGIGLSGAFGTVTVNGLGSSLIGLGLVGSETNAHGVLIVSNGAHVSSFNASSGVNNFVFIGEGNNDVGEATVVGEGSLWDDIAWLTVGGVYHTNTTGHGTLDILDGGRVESQRGIIGQQPLAQGEVTISGTGSRWDVANDITIGPGSGRLTVENGGVAAATSIFVNSSGAIDGNGTLSGSVQNEGVARPGQTTGILTISGNMTQMPSGTIECEVGGTALGTQYDQLAVTGTTSLSGTLEITLINGFTPTSGQSFNVLQCGSRVGQFQAIIGADLGGGLFLSPQYSQTALTLVAQQITGITITPNPSNVYLGFTNQAILTAQAQSGGSFDAAGSASWSIDNPAIATVSSSGVISGLSVGSTTLRASLAGFDVQAPLTVLALPAQLSTERVSLDSNELQGGELSWQPSVSANGRYVVFDSFSANLVPGDTNGQSDIFVRDRLLGITSRASVASGGSQASGSSTTGSISADGRFVVFESSASNLITGDTNNATDVFVQDRQTGQTERISISSDGTQGNGASALAAISSNGRYVAFVSQATNLVLGDTNGVNDVFVRDLQSGQTTRANVASNGDQATGEVPSGSIPSISAGGRFVVFLSLASNLVPSDSNNRADVFIRDTVAGTTERVSVDSSGQEGNGDSLSFRYTVSDDGRFVVFQSVATNLVSSDTNGRRDCFLRDRQTSQTIRINLGPGGVQDNGGVGSVTISSDGRFACFRSFGTNLVADDTNGVDDIFVYNRLTGELMRESVNFYGVQSNGLSQQTALSPDGRYLSYFSQGSNLAPFDTNGVGDVFMRTHAIDGDVNCDGASDISDVPMFVQALTDPAGYAATFSSCFISTADMNGDGSIDGVDVQHFIDALLGG